MYLENKIDYLIAEQKKLAKEIKLFLPNLTTEKGVIHFLEITKNTFNTYMKDGVFIKKYHYTQEGKTKIFVPDAIIELKNNGVKGKRRKSSKQDKLDAVNLQLGMISKCRSAI